MKKFNDLRNLLSITKNQCNLNSFNICVEFEEELTSLALDTTSKLNNLKKRPNWGERFTSLDLSAHSSALAVETPKRNKSNMITPVKQRVSVLN